MKNIQDIQESLTSLGYNGNLLAESELDNVITSGPKSENFREMISWLANEIHILSETEEIVNSKVEFSEFMLEVSGLLKELGCPYDELIGGPLSDRFNTPESRLLLFDFLITHLMAAKMCLVINPKVEDTSNVIERVESRGAKALEMITKDLGLGKPPENISAKFLFEKINKKLILTLDKIEKNILGEPLLKTSKPYTEDQWRELEKINRDLENEYNLRKEMLLTRLDVTIQSFLWSDKMKLKQDEIMKIYQNKKKDIEECNDLETGSLAGLIAARTNRAVIEKVSNARVRKNTASAKVQRHIIGKVPDRGGRAFEHDIPPPEMPSWQQNRSTGPPGGAGGRGGRGGGFGGGQGGNFNRNRGGRGNHNQSGGSGNYQQTGGNGNYQQSGGNSNYQQSGNYQQGGGNGNYQQSGNYQQGGGYQQASTGNDYNQGGSNRRFNQGRDGDNYSQGVGYTNYTQGGGNNYNQNSGNTNNDGYGQSRIQGRGQSYGNERFNSGENRTDRGGFIRGRSYYNRGGGNR